MAVKAFLIMKKNTIWFVSIAATQIVGFMKRNSVRLRAQLFLFLLLAPTHAYADSYGFIGSWGYEEQSDLEDSSEFSNQGLYVNVNRQLGHAFSFGGGVRYTVNRRDSAPRQEMWTPSLSMNLVNDIFAINLNGSVTQNDQEFAAQTSDRHWQGVWSSTWKKKDFVPNIYLSYGENSSIDENEPRLRDIDSQNTAANIDWQLGKVNLAHNFTDNRTNDKIGLLEQTATTNYSKLVYRDAFLKKRLHTTFSQQIVSSQFDYLSSAAQTQLIDVPILNVKSGLDTTPANNTDVTLVDTPALSDSNLSTVAVTVNPGDALNIDTNLNIGGVANQLDRLYIYTDVDITSSVAAQFTWLVYTNQDPAITPNWTQVSVADYVVTYNTAEQRIEIDFSAGGGLTFPYVKIYTSATPAVAVNLTEVEALYAMSFTALTDEHGFSSDSYKTDLGLQYSLDRNIMLNYALGYEAREDSFLNETDTVSHTGSVNWNHSRLLNATFRASYNSKDDLKGADSSTRGVSFDFTSSPLDTLDINVGLGRTEVYMDGEKYVSNDNYSLNATGQLFPDLSSSFDLNYNKSTQPVSGTAADTIDTRLSLTSRMTPQLTLFFMGSFNQVNAQTDVDSEKIDLHMNWRVSDAFSLKAGGEQQWASDQEDILKLTFSMAMSLTRNIQGGINYIYTAAVDETQAASMDLRWNMNKIFSLSASGSYQLANDEEFWKVATRLNANIGSN